MVELLSNSKMIDGYLLLFNETIEYILINQEKT
ncbi:hypothetical protein BD847_0313 [Flavobacterium cutihirudinis]|uniref:Uncharacterized protein n=1 Tax=Flavobacterium cutihirudinis TaxID=1265740 RepID=A0A3D9FZJ3_9FLAO|nr:hypothetical protein BD847_0313 [Flavobacterium cutihirudinis]